MPDKARAPLLHPVALAAIGTLLINDHVFKGTFAPAVTGKLSDFAGLLFFPLLLHALWTVVVPPAGADDRVRRLVAAAVTGAVFTSIQLSAVAGEAFVWSLGVLQWPVHALVQGQLVPLLPVAHTPDPTDLIALPMLGVGIALGGRAER